MTQVDEDEKQLVKQHNRIVFLFFLLVFGLLQLVLAYVFKSNRLTRDALLIIEAVSIGLMILSISAARFSLKGLKATGATFQDLVERHQEIGVLIENTDLMILQIDLVGTIQWVKCSSEGFGGLNIPDIIGQTFETVFQEVTAVIMKRGVEQALSNKGKVKLMNQEVVMSDGQELRLSVEITYVQFQDSGYILWIGRNQTKEWTDVKTKEIMMHFNRLFSADINTSLYYDRLLRELLEAFPLVGSAYLLFDEGEGHLKVKAQTGFLLKSIKEYTLEMKESLFFRHCGKYFRRSLILEGQLLMDGSGEVETLANIQGASVHSMLSCPIHVDGKLVGLINLGSSKTNAFKASDLERMDFIGNQVSKTVSTTLRIEQGIYLSKYDALTGLYNRWQLDEFERNTLPHCVRYKEPFLFVSMTLNDLEQINDHHGYHTGDLYLMTFSKLLRSFTRETDHIFRMGGDRFVGIFFTNDAFTMGGKLELLEQSLGTNMKSDLVIEDRCSFAYGIVAFPEEGQGIAELYQLADERMKQKALEMESDVRYSK